MQHSGRALAQHTLKPWVPFLIIIITRTISVTSDLIVRLFLFFSVEVHQGVLIDLKTLWFLYRNHTLLNTLKAYLKSEKSSKDFGELCQGLKFPEVCSLGFWWSFAFFSPFVPKQILGGLGSSIFALHWHALL